MNSPAFHPVGTPGQPWGAAEKAQWRARQVRSRSHADEVLAPVERLRGQWDVETYGTLDCGRDGRYPLLA